MAGEEHNQVVQYHIDIMDVDSLRELVLNRGGRVQWVGYCEGKSMVRLASGPSYRVVDVDPSQELTPRHDWDTVGNNDSDDLDSFTMSVAPPDTSAFAPVRALSVLGINIGGDCLPGSGKEYRHTEECTCSYDIETDMSQNVDSGMGLVGCEIMSIAAHCSCGVEFFMPTTPGVISSSRVCAEFMEFVRDHRPVWLIGYNCYAFDNMHIHYHLDDHKKRDFMSIRVSGVGTGSDASLINIPGVYNVDVYQYLVRTRNSRFKSMKLAHVAEQLNCTRKTAMPPMNSKVGYDELKAYNMNDCVVALEVWTKSNIYLEIPNLAVVTGSHIYDSCRYITGFMMACAFATEALKLRKSILWGLCTDPQDYGGGLVLEPKCGIYENVEIYDFKSMYPSVMIACNISPESMVSKRDRVQSDDNLPVYSVDGTVSTMVLEHTVVRFDRSITSIPCSIMATMVALRSKVKKSNPPYAAALKIGANSFYGALGYSHSPLYSPSCSSAITTVARQCLRTAVRVSEEVGKRVIYGDTDSVFVTSSRARPEDSRTIGTDELLHKLSVALAQAGLAGVEMEREALFTRLVLMGKKRYCALGDDGSLKLTGISAVRQDCYGIVKECSRGMAQALLMSEFSLHKAALVAYMEAVLDRLAQNKLSLYESSKLVKRHGVKGYHYTDSAGLPVTVSVEDASLSSVVDCDKTVLAKSLGAEMSRFTVACGMGSPSVAMRDYAVI